MAFVNPNSPAFSNDPSDPWTQSIMTCVGAFIAIVSQILPCPNEALVKATELTAELAETVAAVIEGLPFATKDEVSLAIELFGLQTLTALCLCFAVLLNMKWAWGARPGLPSMGPGSGCLI